MFTSGAFCVDAQQVDWLYLAVILHILLGSTLDLTNWIAHDRCLPNKGVSSPPGCGEVGCALFEISLLTLLFTKWPPSPGSTLFG